MINVDHPDEIIDIIDINKHNDNIIDNNKHKDTLSYQSYLTICDNLYNMMKEKKTISKCVVGMLLEMKMDMFGM